MLIIPFFLINAAAYTGNLAMTSSLAIFITILSKLALIIITIHYAIKLNIKDLLAIVLGLSTILPLMPWIALLILLTR